MAYLSSGFFKYRHDPYKDRVSIFLNKLKNKSPFTLQLENNLFEVVLNPEWEWAYLECFNQNKKPKFIIDENNNRFKFNSIVKTTEFGGEPSGYRTKKEKSTCEHLQEQINEAKGTKNFIFIKIKHKKYKISNLIQFEGYNCKADFALVDENNKAIVFISHKDGYCNPKEFGQWSGISYFTEHSEVNDFLQTLKIKFPDGIPKGHTAVYRKIKDTNLKKSAVYGLCFNNFDCNRQNVDLVIQGKIYLKEVSKSCYELECSQIWHNGDEVIDDFEPVLLARYANDRNDGGFNFTRITIYPIGGRKVIPID